MSVPKNSEMDVVIGVTAAISLVWEIITYYKTGCVIGPKGAPLMCNELAPIGFTLMTSLLACISGNVFYRWYMNRLK